MRMTISPDRAYAVAPTARTLASVFGVLGLMTALAGCAGDALTSLMPATAAPAAAPAAAAPVATAPAPAPAAQPAKPTRLTATQINEKCWMSAEVNKIADLESREVLLAKLAGAMKGNLAKAAAVFAAPATQFARLAAALQEKKAAAEAHAES